MRDSISAITLAGRPERGASLLNAWMSPSRKRARCKAVQADVGCDILVLYPLGCQQHDARTLLNTLFTALALRQDPKLPLRLRIQLNSLGNPHRPPLGRLEYDGASKFYDFARFALGGGRDASAIGATGTVPLAPQQVSAVVDVGPERASAGKSMELEARLTAAQTEFRTC